MLSKDIWLLFVLLIMSYSSMCEEYGECQNGACRYAFTYMDIKQTYSINNYQVKLETDIVDVSTKQLWTICAPKIHFQLTADFFEECSDMSLQLQDACRYIKKNLINLSGNLNETAAVEQYKDIPSANTLIQECIDWNGERSDYFDGVGHEPFGQRKSEKSPLNEFEGRNSRSLRQKRSTDLHREREKRSISSEESLYSSESSGSNEINQSQSTTPRKKKKKKNKNNKVRKPGKKIRTLGRLFRKKRESKLKLLKGAEENNLVNNIRLQQLPSQQTLNRASCIEISVKKALKMCGKAALTKN